MPPGPDDGPMNSTRSPWGLAAVGAILWFLAGFVQGMLRTSADPELVLGFSELCRAVGWVCLIGAGIGLGRQVAHR